MRKFLIALGLIFFGFIGRLIPHPPNATPITGITIAARRELGAVWAYVIPLLAMFASDAVIGFYDWKVLVSVYGSFALIALLSRFAHKNGGVGRIFLTAVASSVLFFLVTNTAVWVTSAWYEKSITGLLYCFTLGLPFLRNMLAGDIAYVSLLLAIEKAPRFARRFGLIFSRFGLSTR